MSIARARARFWGYAPVLPLAVLLGARTRRKMIALPEAAGPRSGTLEREGSVFDLAVLGESTAAGVGVSEQEEGLAFNIARAMKRNVRLQIAGESGATVKRVHELMEQLTFPVDAVVVTVGVNDTVELTRGSVWSKRVGALVTELKTRGARDVVVSGLPPLGAFRVLPQPTRSAVGARAAYLDQLLRHTCEQKGARYIPLRLPLRQELLASDGFHPSAVGYAEWATALVADAF